MNGSKRKQLAVPMVALMVCAVAFIGIGYALTSSYTTTHNAVTSGALQVDVDSKAGDSALFTEAKIPYATINTDGTIKAKVEAGPHQLNNGNKTISDNTDKGYTVYKVTATITGTIGGVTPTITVGTTSGSGSATEQTSNDSIALKIEVTLSDQTEYDPESLSATGIVVTISAEGISIS